jgi:hypothetical protein
MADITPLSEQRSHLIARGVNNPNSKSYDKVAELRTKLTKRTISKPEGILRRRAGNLRGITSGMVVKARRALDMENTDHLMIPQTEPPTAEEIAANNPGSGTLSTLLSSEVPHGPKPGSRQSESRPIGRRTARRASASEQAPAITPETTEATPPGTVEESSGDSALADRLATVAKSGKTHRGVKADELAKAATRVQGIHTGKKGKGAIAREKVIRMELNDIASTIKAETRAKPLPPTK